MRLRILHYKVSTQPLSLIAVLRVQNVELRQLLVQQSFKNSQTCSVYANIVFLPLPTKKMYRTLPYKTCTSPMKLFRITNVRRTATVVLSCVSTPFSDATNAKTLTSVWNVLKKVLWIEASSLVNTVLTIHSTTFRESKK